MAGKGYTPPGGGSGLTPEQSETLEHIEYVPAEDELQTDVPLAVTLSSLKLLNQWRFSSGNITPFFGNISEEICHYFPIAGIKRQSVPANQDSSGLIPMISRIHSDDLEHEQPNPTLGAGIVDYNITFTILCCF